jgi:Uncharacterized protein conserved in bacteria (DUF2188)
VTCDLHGFFSRAILIASGVGARPYDASRSTTREDALMASKRDVKKNAAGGWEVLREGDRRAAVRADTKERALARARAVVRREGGGEVRVVNDAGKIVRSSKVGTQTATPMRRRRAA